MDRLAALLDFHRDDPDDPFTRFALAQEFLKRGDAERAQAFFEGLVRDHPGYVGTYYHLGKLYETLGQDERAAATYRAGVLPRPAAILYALGYSATLLVGTVAGFWLALAAVLAGAGLIWFGRALWSEMPVAG